MADKAPDAQNGGPMPEFVEFTEMWRSGDKAKAKAFLATALRAPSNKKGADPSPPKTAIQAASEECNKIVMHPVSIEIASSLPIDTIEELQSLYRISKNVIASLIVEWNDKGKLPFPLVQWMKEARTLLVELHKSTAGFQEKTALKKMDVAAAVIAASPDLRDDFKVAMIKELEQYELMARKPKVVSL